MNQSGTRNPNTENPSLLWRALSHSTIFAAGSISRAFLYVFNQTQVNGLSAFLDLLKSRSNYKDRQRGLLTVSNHVSVIDDPLIWGVLPFSFAAIDGYLNHRFSLASHDICFNSPVLSHFFTIGQTLPTHRLAHSQYGGISQPTMTEAVRLLSRISANQDSWSPNLITSDDKSLEHQSSWPHDCVDPFSDIAPAPSYPSHADDTRRYMAPSRYACNSYSWIHIFPEGMIHQSTERDMRYFKWGVARLILEPPECPDVVPMFIEGTDQIMHESRQFPRFIPRIGNKVVVTFGQPVDTQATFGDLRDRWRVLQKHMAKHANSDPRIDSDEMLGVLPPALIDGIEAVELRKECTRRLRQEVLKVRQTRGYPNEDPKAGLAETYIREGPKREGMMKDETWIKDA